MEGVSTRVDSQNRHSVTVMARLMARMPLWTQLALLVVATAAPLLLAAVLMFNRVVASDREGVRKDLMLSARILADLIDTEIVAAWARQVGEEA